MYEGGENQFHPLASESNCPFGKACGSWNLEGQLCRRSALFGGHYYLLIFLHLFSCVCGTGDVHMLRYLHGGQRTTWRDQSVHPPCGFQGSNGGSFHLSNKWNAIAYWASLQPDKVFSSQQVTDQTPGKIVPEIPAFQAHSEFQKAYDILQRVRNSPPASPTPAQVFRNGEAAGREGRRWRLCHPQNWAS